MTEDEKNRHITKLEMEVRLLTEKSDSMQVQLTAIFDLFMVPDPMGDGTSTRAKRMMDVVNAWESGKFAVKWGVRIILTIGAIVVAIKGMGITWTLK